MRRQAEFRRSDPNPRTVMTGHKALAPSAPAADPTSEPLRLPTDTLASRSHPHQSAGFPRPFAAPTLTGLRRRHAEATPKGWVTARRVGSADPIPTREFFWAGWQFWAGCKRLFPRPSYPRILPKSVLSKKECQTRDLRRSKATTPNAPDPNNTRLAGSGVTRLVGR
jgi:hypothetical protein